MLALIVVQQSHWQALVSAIVDLQTDQQTRDRTAAAFQAVLSTNGVTASLNKPNRARFRENLHMLLQHFRASRIKLPQ